MNTPRYLIGVDLGTSNSVVAYTDALDSTRTAHVLPITQFSDNFTEVDQPLLRSVLYLADQSELEGRQLSFQQQPTQSPIVGELARIQLNRNPERVIQSAKSWLCHAGIDRHAPILPWESHSVAESAKLSPVQASAAVLSYIRTFWDDTIGRNTPELRLANQFVTVTVPASFDEVSQKLTLEAAVAAGFPDNTALLEEPQAAFLTWLRTANSTELASLHAAHPDRKAVVLVCDIGGGTSDFTLFEIDFSSSLSQPHVERIEVSDHILLGGDNLDLTVAHLAEHAHGKKFTLRQWQHVLAQSRELKERVLQGGPSGGNASADGGDTGECIISIPAEGSALFAGSTSIALSAKEVGRALLDGFFPQCHADDRPTRSSIGLREIGLPFSSDTGITRHLAAFLRGRAISGVLFTGGTLIPEFLRSRLSDQLREWQKSDPLVVLSNQDFEHGVAIGAADYSTQRYANAFRIAGGYPRSLYLEISHREVKRVRRAVCVLSKGTIPGARHSVTQSRFTLLTGRPVRFQLFYSNHRPEDKLGELIDVTDEAFLPLAPLQTVIKDSQRAKQESREVVLESHINELGLFSLACLDALDGRRWLLDFDVRPSGGTDTIANEDQTSHPRLREAREKVLQYFGKNKSGTEPTEDPRRLLRELEEILGEKVDWTLPTLRGLWEPLESGMGRRTRSPTHEAAWLRLVGFCLRPGYGAALDESRIKDLSRLIQQGVSFPKVQQNKVEWYLLWRRVAGGLDEDQQGRLLSALKKEWSSLHPELIRLIGSLERLPKQAKLDIAEYLLRLIRKGGSRDAACWSLARLLSRVPLYASGHYILPPDTVQSLLEQLCSDATIVSDRSTHMLFAYACRDIGVRSLDITPDFRARVVMLLKENKARSDLIQMVSEYVPVSSDDQLALFGESLPSGLRLVETKEMPPPVCQ